MRRSPGFYNYPIRQQETPDDPAPPEPEKDPTHDVPAFPDQDSPPGTPTALGFDGAIGFESPDRGMGPGQHEVPDEGDDDVDDGATHASHGQPREGVAPNMSGQCPRNDLDPQVPHSPPDGKRGKIVFDENGVAG